MSRSPLFYPLNRGMDAEAGGAADLQTDVMRFMAIISLCLVAIFALVQTIPLAPKIPEIIDAMAETAIPIVTASQQAAPQPEAQAQAITLPSADPVPEPIRDPVPQPSPVTTPPAPAAVTEPLNEPIQQPPIPAVTTPEEGFTLQFEDDAALMRLVAQGDVKLYAMAADQALQMNVSHGQTTFLPASSPQQFHEMDIRTVPESVVRALRRSGKVPPAAVNWSVTLPDNMSLQLNKYLRERRGGQLLISTNGTLRIGQ
jgi:hypothetical protein